MIGCYSGKQCKDRGVDEAASDFRFFQMAEESLERLSACSGYKCGVFVSGRTAVGVVGGDDVARSYGEVSFGCRGCVGFGSIVKNEIFFDISEEYLVMGRRDGDRCTAVEAMPADKRF